jgi:flagellar biosynthetic protein FliR
LFFDGHHLILLYLSDSLSEVTLGGFYPHDGLLKVMVSAVANLFKLGLIIAFPIIALSLLSDIIFGMLMKTMPQFNLLVVGFPIKIFLSTLVLVTILGSMMKLFREDFLRYFELLKALF